MISRRTTISVLAAGALTALSPPLANAQGKALTILVGYPASGAVDVIARRLGEELRAQAYNAAVEYRTGAATNTPGFAAAIEKLEFDAGTMPSAVFPRYLKADFERSGPVTKTTGYASTD